MGLAFQLQDDYLDVYGDPATFGKKIGGDILCNKKTYMLITALQLAKPDDRKALEGWLAATDADPAEKIAAVTALYNKVGIAERCREKIAAYYAEGLQSLEEVGVEAALKQPLKDYVGQLMNRQL